MDKTQYISATDLILNENGSIYHLNLLPEDVGDLIILVGDPDRVPQVSRLFDEVELMKGKREFITHTGYLAKKRLTVISTGIGTDNIDIVLNELDALINIDLKTRTVNQNLRCIDIIRIGTSGALQPDIPIDSLLISSGAFGLDALMHYYTHKLSATDRLLLQEFESALSNIESPGVYYSPAGNKLLQQFEHLAPTGITVTAPGFYSPQGRQVRAVSAVPNLMPILSSFESAQGRRITNFEMETAGIYGLAACLGHQALSFNVILANRATNQFSTQPLKIMDKYIALILESISR